MAGNPETLKVIKENIKEKFNISKSVKVKKFLGVYYKWGHDSKLMYGNVGAALLWLRLLDKYLVNKCNLKRRKADS